MNDLGTLPLRTAPGGPDYAGGVYLPGILSAGVELPAGKCGKSQAKKQPNLFDTLALP